ncbi:MAG: hypothetical protein V9E95_09420 [Methanothrix soehngenii]
MHRFDSVGGILYYGDGRVRRVPESRPDSDGSALVKYADLVAAGPDGTVFLSYYGVDNTERILRRKPGG